MLSQVLKEDILALDHDTICVSIYKVWTNQELEILAQALSKSDHIASFKNIH